MRQMKFHDARLGAAITVRVTPNAKKDGLVGLMDDGTLKVKVSAPAVEGAANRALLDFLAKTLGVKSSSLEIVAGAKGRDKLVSVTGMNAATVQEKLLAQLEADRRRESGRRTKAGKKK